MPHFPPTLPLHPRADALTSARTTLSSWPSCMSKPYCKYPVIVSLILASVLVLSLLYCVSRCLCCGGSGSGRRRRGTKEKERGYERPGRYERRPPMMGYTAGPVGYARFGASGGGRFNEDALPAMPSWEQGVKRRVQLQKDGVEHEPNEVSPAIASNGVQGGQTIPLMGPVVTRSPYAPPLQAPPAPANGYFNPPQQLRRPPVMAAQMAETPPAPFAPAAAAAPMSPLEMPVPGGRSVYEIDTRNQAQRSVYEVDAQSMRHPFVGRDYAPRYWHGSMGSGSTGYVGGQQRQEYVQDQYGPDGQGYGGNTRGRYAGEGEGEGYGYGEDGGYGRYNGQESPSAARMASSTQAQTPFGQPPQHQQQFEGAGRQIVRKPVQGTWRDI